MTPAQWARVFHAGWHEADAGSELERVLEAMEDAAREIAGETE